jgi:hypothetical protein
MYLRPLKVSHHATPGAGSILDSVGPTRLVFNYILKQDKTASEFVPARVGISGESGRASEGKGERKRAGEDVITI